MKHKWHITSHPTVPSPEQPNINKDTIEATSDTITFSWSLGLYIDYSVVMWQIEDSGSPTNDGVSEKIDAPVDSYTIEGLKSDTEYSITVTVVNPAGNVTSHAIKVTTNKSKEM